MGTSIQTLQSLPHPQTSHPSMVENPSDCVMTKKIHTVSTSSRLYPKVGLIAVAALAIFRGIGPFSPQGVSAAPVFAQNTFPDLVDLTTQCPLHPSLQAVDFSQNPHINLKELIEDNNPEALPTAITELDYDPNENTPLYDAIKLQKPEMVKSLLENGANPNALVDYRPLIFQAVEQAMNKVGNQEEAFQIIRLLHQYGADLNIRLYDGAGETPLETIAWSMEHSELMQLLFDLGVEINNFPRSSLASVLTTAIRNNDHKLFGPIPWYENDDLWIKNVEDPRIKCVRRAKDFVLKVEQLFKNRSELDYFIVLRNEGEKNNYLSYEDSRNIKWQYHVVILYSLKGNRYVLDPLKYKKLFEYNSWKSEITEQSPNKFKCLTLSEFDGPVIDQGTGRVVGVSVKGKILKIDQDL